MKNLLIGFIVIGLMLTSCSSETDIETASQENLTLDLALEKIVEQSENAENAIDFNVSFLADGNVRLEKANIIQPDFVSDFVKGYDNGIAISTSSDNQRAVTVCCSVNGEDLGCVECSGSNEGSCVGGAIRACLDSDGCAEVCNQRIRYIPSLKTFYLSR